MINERKITIMKKSYIKPVAMNVAFMVNENIAVSYDEAVTGTGSFSADVGNPAGQCNKFVNNTGIETGLPYGEANASIGAAMDYAWSHGNIGKLMGMLKTDEAGNQYFDCL